MGAQCWYQIGGIIHRAHQVHVWSIVQDMCQAEANHRMIIGNDHPHRRSFHIVFPSRSLAQQRDKGQPGTTGESHESRDHTSSKVCIKACATCMRSAQCAFEAALITDRLATLQPLIVHHRWGY